MFERLREKLEAALAAATKAEDPRAVVGRMREALIEMRAAIRPIKDALQDTEKQLAAARADLDTAQRRRAMAADINDGETVTVADKYIARLTDRVAVQEQKAAAQQAELALAEQELGEMNAQFEAALKERGGTAAGQSAEAAWQSLGRAGMDRPGTDTNDDLLRTRMDRAAREAEAAAKLAEIKRRMGKS